MIQSLFKSTHCVSLCIHTRTVHSECICIYLNKKKYKYYIIYTHIENRLCKHCLRRTLDFVEALIYTLRFECIHVLNRHCFRFEFRMISNILAVDRMKQLISFSNTSVLPQLSLLLSWCCWHIDCICVKKNTQLLSSHCFPSLNPIVGRPKQKTVSVDDFRIFHYSLVLRT